MSHQIRRLKLGLMLLGLISTIYSQNVSVIDRISGGFSTISDVEMSDSGDRFYLLNSVVDSVWVNGDLAISGPFSDPIYGATYLLSVEPDGSVGFIENLRFNTGDFVIGDSSIVLFISFNNDTLWVSNTYFVNSAPVSGHNLLALEYDYSGNLINYKHWALIKENTLYINKIIYNNGDFYVSGECYKDTFFLDNHFVIPDIGNGDIFIAKLNKLFEVSWMSDFGHKGNDYINDIDCDVNGNIIFTGDFGSNYIFCDSDTLFNEWALFNSFDMFICRLDSEGKCDWMRQIKDTSSVSGSGSAYSSSGHIVISGNYNGLYADFGDTTLINPTDLTNGFLAKYSVNGDFLDVQQLSGENIIVDRGLSIGQGNDIWSCGYFESDSLTVGGNSYSSFGGLDAFLIQYDEFSVPKKSYIFGGTGNDYFVTINRCGNEDLLAVLLSRSETIIIGNENFTNDLGWVDAYIVNIHYNANSTLSPSALAQQLQIYPNPSISGGRIKYLLEHDSRVEGYICIYSIDGRLILQDRITNNCGELLIPELVPGVYLLRFIDFYGNSTVERIVIH